MHRRAAARHISKARVARLLDGSTLVYIALRAKANRV